MIQHGVPSHSAKRKALATAIALLSADAETDGDMGEVSDGYHTFNQLYHQRAVLFATIVKQNKEKAWKSWKHGDGKFCFDSNKEWFIVGVDTPEGSYAYHYEKKYWDMFDCVELEHGKFWDGHTEEDVTRLLSLPSADPNTGEWIPVSERLPETHPEYVTENPWTQVSIVQDTYQLSDPVLGFGKRKRDHGEDPMMAVVWYEDDGYDRTAWITAPDCEDIDVLAWMPLPDPYREESEA
jgi:hypothetical protein